MAEELLPLFPLQVVLFPRSALPLHIFEERYKVLIHECLQGRSEFGVILSREGGLSRVGCSATVESVLHHYQDGRMDIVVEGRRRFALKRGEAGSKGYTLGWVDYLSSTAEEVDTRLAADTLALYNRLMTIVYQGNPPAAGRAGQELSFRIAQKAGLDLNQRQHLLETSSENDRLGFLRGYLVELIPGLEKAGEIERVVRSDGYL